MAREEERKAEEEPSNSGPLARYQVRELLPEVFEIPPFVDQEDPAGPAAAPPASIAEVAQDSQESGGLEDELRQLHQRFAEWKAQHQRKPSVAEAIELSGEKRRTVYAWIRMYPALSSKEPYDKTRVNLGVFEEVIRKSRLRKASRGKATPPT